MADYRTVFENDYPGADAFTQSCLAPVFGPIQRAKRSLNLSDVDKTIVKDIFIFGSSKNFAFGEMNFFDVTLQDKVDIARSRVTIQRAVRKSLDDYQAAIVIFHYENNRTAEQSELWRFSFVNKGDGAKNTTQAKRYSYLCGKGRSCRTAADNLEKLAAIPGNKKLEDIAAVFSIEALTEDFFKRLFKWYDTWAVNAVRFPVGSGKTARLPTKLDEAAKKENRQHLIRLITRIIFVWFLRHKENLIPDWIFDAEELKNIINDFDEHDGKSGSYYNAVLQNLFFATLNCEISKRKFFDDRDGRDGYGIKAKYRDHVDKPMIRIPHRDFIKKMESIPFLNGGLFECLDSREGREEQEYKDGFSRKSKRAAFVPNSLFFGGGGHEGLFDIFSQYNFTIEENTPQDIEIALDPELLGKVFENLLGTYNEETAGTARNESGSFYTPREIVEYMVDVSLKEYLKGRLASGGEASPKTPPSVEDSTAVEKLDALFICHEEGHDFSAEEVSLLIQAIQDCKILDPACGSGAFPMGILNKLTFILGKLDPENKQWKELQRKKALADTEEAFTIGDRKQREDRLKEISDVFEFNSGNYGRKLYLIENCVYGVDIQPIAIQISKLRFFISLIVDQKTGGTIDNNYNVLPLPNLETKFVAANTLIGIKRNQDGLADPRIEETQKELLEIRHRHFRPRTVKEKDRLREKDIKLTGELLDLLKEDGFYNSADAAQMAKWNPYNQTEPSGFFDPWWMFGIKDGFDVVIGNPPYISALEFKKIYTENTRKVFNEEYISAAGAYDYFVLFIEKGISLCNDKGYLCFITPNKYLSASYAKKLREYILLNSSIKTVVDVSGINVFENAAIYPVITLFSKQQSHEKYLTAMLIEKTDVFHFDISNYKKYSIPREYLNLLPENIWGFLLSKNVHMLEKLINGATPLASIAGINATSTAGEADEFSICISNKETKNSKKIINTGTIDPYVSLWGKERMTNKGEKFLTPYLDIKKAKVSQRRINMYNSEKIIFAKMAKRVEAFLDIAGEYSSINTNCLYAPKDVSFKYLIAVINSKTFMFLYDLLFGALKMSGGYYQFQAPQLRIMPILIDKNNQTIFDGLVDKILTAKAADPKADTTALERQINNLVYRLYNLTYEEVKVIEPDFPLGKAEYEGME